MTRFEEVTRMKELEQKALPAWKIVEQDIETQIVSGDEEIFDDGSSHSEYYSNFGADDPNINLAVDLRNAAPWLLEALACFQPGDAERIRTVLLALNDPIWASCVEVLTRHQKAAAIMGGQE